jgi:CheY-like chemotaxis protein
MTRDYKPCAVTLDIFLPDIEGWRVLERLKNDLTTRHVPVCVISTEEARERALGLGALAFVAKPIKRRETVDLLLDSLKGFVNRPEKTLLIVEPNDDRRQTFVKTVEGVGASVSAVADAQAALTVLKERPVDCLVLGAPLTYWQPERLVEAVERDSAAGQLPVLLYDDSGLEADEAVYKRLAAVGAVRQVQSYERLLDQVVFFLHGVVDKLPAANRQVLEALHLSDQVLPGKKVLIVDDDMRNIFALSTVLEDHEMIVVSADNGRDAIKLLHSQRDVDVVLMDIMMPEMDGIDTMREIRKVPALKSLPIIAVTAKAMKGDREKCIEAGAWDYLSKPVDTEQMLAVLRAWLHR